MGSTTMRVTTQVRDRVNEVARRTRQPVNVVIARALDAYEAEQFWQQYGDAARRDTDGADSTEQEAWERALADGLDG